MANREFEQIVRESCSCIPKRTSHINVWRYSCRVVQTQVFDVKILFYWVGKLVIIASHRDIFSSDHGGYFLRM